MTADMCQSALIEAYLVFFKQNSFIADENPNFFSLVKSSGKYLWEFISAVIHRYRGASSAASHNTNLEVNHGGAFQFFHPRSAVIYVDPIPSPHFSYLLSGCNGLNGPGVQIPRRAIQAVPGKPSRFLRFLERSSLPGILRYRRKSTSQYPH